jgi:hypothetical protein
MTLMPANDRLTLTMARYLAYAYRGSETSSEWNSDGGLAVAPGMTRPPASKQTKTHNHFVVLIRGKWQFTPVLQWRMYPAHVPVPCTRVYTHTKTRLYKCTRARTCPCGTQTYTHMPTHAHAHRRTPPPPNTHTWPQTPCTLAHTHGCMCRHTLARRH